jgi:hypothetical protein
MLKNLLIFRNLKYFAVIAVVLFVGFLTRLWYQSSHSPKKIVTVGTEVTAPKQTKVPQANEKVATTNNSGCSNAVGAKYTLGATTTTNDSSQWTSSASGVITVKSPTPNATLKDDSLISGSAKVGSVHYRLNDNKVGVIAQGELGVVNGNFSGTLHFTSHGTGARLDIFSTDDQGIEFNEVQINVSF